MADVNIIIKAVDQASATLNKIGASLDNKVNKGFKSAASTLEKYGGALNNSVQQLTGFNLAQLAGVGAVTMAITKVRQAVTAYSDYAERIDKLSMSTGMATEEISRLVQVADDFRVDMGQMEGALKMALQNGFNPTTDALADLADRMEGITDPTQRAAELQKIFGRQWQNIIPLLDRGGDAIREASDSIADGLIITEEGRQANREYQAAVDKMGDAWTALSNTMAQEALPAITAVTNALAGAIDESAQNQRKLEGITGGYGRAAAAAQARTRALIGMTDEEKRARDAAQKNAQVIEQEYTPAIVDSTSSVERYESAIHRANVGMEGAAERASIMAGAASDLASATADLQAKQEEWKEGAGSDVKSMLEDSYLPADKFREGIDAVDQAQGTAFGNAMDLEKAQRDLVKQFAQGKIDAGEFKQGLEDLNNKFMPLDESIQDSTELMQGLLDKLNEFSRQWTASVRIDATAALATMYPGGGQSNQNGYKPGTTGAGVYGYTDYTSGGKRAGGGPVWGGRSYLVGEEGPEILTMPPGSRGQVIPNDKIGGDTYNLNVYTTQSPQVVQRGFAIMRAWAGV